MAGGSARAQPFPDAHEPAPAGWSGPVFKLRQDYPQAPPPAEKVPWKAYDFKTQPLDYLRSVLQYAYEGNLEVDWQVQRNTKRAWYHAPWMHWHDGGREFVHGLTRERDAHPGELDPQNQNGPADCFQNWAVSVYNAPGGYVIGKVWKNPRSPDPSQAVFPDGTVAVKLLFTQAPVEKVPYLKGSIEWQANVHMLTDPPCSRQPAFTANTPRHIETLRLLQIDVAVRDDRANETTGWVFGTFIYNGNKPGTSAWDRMVPVGLMWGNDKDLTPDKYSAGQRPVESAINAADQPVPPHLGWLGRLDGPVDNPISSCLSCHATAHVPGRPSTFRSADPLPVKMAFFDNVKCRGLDSSDKNATDYSLQLSSGINFFNMAQPPGFHPQAAALEKVSSSEIPRSGSFDPAEKPVPSATRSTPPHEQTASGAAPPTISSAVLVSYLWGFGVVAALWILYGIVTRTWGPWAAIYGADGRPSTSKLQAFLWTVAAFFAYGAFYAARSRAGVTQPIDALPSNLLAALGLSLGTMAVAKGITTGYVNSGRVAKTPAAGGASAGFGGVFLDDDDTPDLSKIQMMAWTFIAIGVYLFALHHRIGDLFSARPGADASKVALPDIDTALMALMGLGQGAYLGKKLTASTVSRITGLSPSSGPPGVAITITGTCLGSGPDGNAVTLDGHPIAYVAPDSNSWTDTAIRFTLPAQRADGAAWSAGQVVSIGVISGGQPSVNALPFTISGGGQAGRSGGE